MWCCDGRHLTSQTLIALVLLRSGPTAGTPRCTSRPSCAAAAAFSTASNCIPRCVLYIPCHVHPPQLLSFNDTPHICFLYATAYILVVQCAAWTARMLRHAGLGDRVKILQVRLLPSAADERQHRHRQAHAMSAAAMGSSYWFFRVVVYLLPESPWPLFYGSVCRHMFLAGGCGRRIVGASAKLHRGGLLRGAHAPAHSTIPNPAPSPARYLHAASSSPLACPLPRLR